MSGVGTGPPYVASGIPERAAEDAAEGIAGGAAEGTPLDTTSGIEAGVAGRLRENARDFPDKPAIVYPSAGGFAAVTFREVDERSDACAAGFRAAGIGPGTKTVVMVKPGPELFTVVFGLLKAGAVPVIADPGLGVRRMLHCYRSVGATAFVGIPEAHVVRVLSRRTFGALRTHVTVGRRWFWGGPTLNGLGADPGAGYVPHEPAGDDLLAISFTTGSTGPAKGVEHPVGMVTGIVRQIETALGQRRDDVALVTVPIWGLFGLLIGSTCVLPPGDPARVGSLDPEKVLGAIEAYGVTTMFASPALLDRLAPHAAGRVGTVRSVVSGGAPVRPDIADAWCRLLGDPSRFTTTYGATEALPIASSTAADLAGPDGGPDSGRAGDPDGGGNRASDSGVRERTLAGAGTCVGRTVPGVEARIVRTTDGPLPVWSGDLLAAPGDIGEITVSGPTVSRRYHGDPAADALAKIADGDRVWHRTGDLGRVDEEGRLWFCGRKSQRVRTAAGDLHTACCEGVLNAVPGVRRSAVVGVGPPGAQRPVACVEAEPGADRAQVAEAVRARAAACEVTAAITDVRFHPRFPTDIRHDAKIGRERLADWASGRGRWRARLPRAVPVAGWLFLAYGLARPFGDPWLAAIFWIDAFLSVPVHAVQLPKALARARRAGIGPARAVALTFLFGATWWRSL